MGLFSKKRKASPSPEYDAAREFPVVRCSICSGEQVAGFRDRTTGHFREDRVIRSPEELEEFRRQCNVEQVVKEY